MPSLRSAGAFYEFGMVPVWPIVTLGVAAFVAMRGQVLGGAFVVVAALVRPIGTILKEIVERPRPSAAHVSYVEGASGWSFPSGHVFGTVLLVGFIAYVLIERETNAARRRLIAATAGAIMFLMGVQRVFAGAHAHGRPRWLALGRSGAVRAGAGVPGAAGPPRERRSVIHFGDDDEPE
jgi:undecaprenyl-diphosphatase